jgi:hypothetical protein
VPGRFDLRPLVRGVGQGLRKRRDIGPEAADVKARAVLVGLPLATAATCAIIGFVLPKADQLIAGAALLVGALFAAFTQVAAWRDRIAARKNATDAVDLRALSEAGAHILLTVVISLLATADLVVLANLDVEEKNPDLFLSITTIALSALGVGAFTYMTLSLYMVVNLLWDAYEKTAGAVAPLDKS